MCITHLGALRELMKNVIVVQQNICDSTRPVYGMPGTHPNIIVCGPLPSARVCLWWNEAGAQGPEAKENKAA